MEGGKRRVFSGIETRDEAERLLAIINSNLSQGRTGLPRDATRIGELAPAFLKRREETYRAADCDRSRWKNT
jgi:hypothetical protein